MSTTCTSIFRLLYVMKLGKCYNSHMEEIKTILIIGIIIFIVITSKPAPKKDDKKGDKKGGKK